MKTDSQRQIEYQQRRQQTQDRITIWVSKEVEHAMDTLRAQHGNETRTKWLNRAITELSYRQLLDKEPLPYSDEEIRIARQRAKKLGITLPD